MTLGRLLNISPPPEQDKTTGLTVTWVPSVFPIRTAPGLTALARRPRTRQWGDDQAAGKGSLEPAAFQAPRG